VGASPPEAKRATFRVGEHLVHPHHGVTVLEGRERRQLGTSPLREYFVLRAAHADLVVWVPVDRASELGVRQVMSAAEAIEVLEVLSKPVRLPGGWARRFKNHSEKLRSGDLHEIMAVVRNLVVLNVHRKISAAETKMLARARDMVVPELMLALGQSRDAFDQRFEELMVSRPTVADRLAS
jgi:CarD family transcriptional regulator